MIRKIFMLAVVVLLFIYTVWNFYARALNYDPLAEVALKKVRQFQSDSSLSAKHGSGWSDAIFENNLFSPNRTYKEPKPAVLQPSPAVVEPPRRPELALKGIVLDDFGDYVAFIEIDKGKALPLRKGDRTNDIELVDLSDRQVVVKWNEENITLSIDKIKTILNPRSAK